MNRRNSNSNKNMTRESFRRKRTPFYKRKPFIISLILIIILIIGLLIFWKSSSSKDNTHATQPSHKIEKVKPKKETKKKSTKKKSVKKAKKQKAADEITAKQQENDNKQKDDQQKKTTNQIKNAGTYTDLTYDTDWYTFKISNDVKLIKDSNGDAALLVKYNYTNKTQNNEIPQRVQNTAIMLKQNNQQLTATAAKGEYATIVNSSNNGLVQPNKSFDGALLVKVKDTDSEVTMYFKNIQTNDWLDTTQPLKLK